MQVIPRYRLPFLLRAAGLEVVTREFPEAENVHRLTVREAEPMPFTTGPHRKIVYPDGRLEGPFPVADRPALSQFVGTIFQELKVERVLATISEGTFWLNNKALSAYLWKVPDAQRVARFLRQRGLTDRFQGGFVIQRPQFETTLPLLAANTYSGGSDVLFSALPSPSFSCRVTVLFCHHFDLHIATPDASLLESVTTLAARKGLDADSLALPEF